MKLMVMVAIVISAAGIATPTPSKKHEINAAETEALVRAAIYAEWPRAKRLPGLGFVGEMFPNPYYPRYRFFDVTWNGPHNLGGAVVGFIAVDPLTADTWNGIKCEAIVFPQVLAMQRSIRQRIGLSDQQYKSIKAPGPKC